MAAWFRKTETEVKAEDVPSAVDDADAADIDAPTGQISGASLSRIIEEADGTDARADASEPDVEPVGLVALSPVVDLDQALADRKALIQLCLYAMDRARSGGVTERIEQGLTAIGVTAMRPDGQRFDPALHEAGGAMPTGDTNLEGTVAETEVVGFADRGRLLRAPVVTVYTRR